MLLLLLLLQLEFAAAYHRLCGKRVLFGQGFHCTGMPIKVGAVGGCVGWVWMEVMVVLAGFWGGGPCFSGVIDLRSVSW